MFIIRLYCIVFYCINSKLQFAEDTGISSQFYIHCQFFTKIRSGIISNAFKLNILSCLLLPATDFHSLIVHTWNAIRKQTKFNGFLPPGLAVEVIKMEPSVGVFTH